MDKEWHLMKSIFRFMKRDDFQLDCKKVPGAMTARRQPIPIDAVFKEF